MSDSKLKIDIRRDKILELLQKNGKVQVSELSRLTGATPVTIRSDLDSLARDGYLIRVQGGALLKPREQDPWTEDREIARYAEKESIARAVAARIPNGSTLFLNSGSTTRIVAKALKDHKNLNVVTNSLAVARELADAPDVHVIILGGEINLTHGFTYGADAEYQLQRYQAGWSVLSVDGVTAAGGITTFHPEETNINRMMIARSENTIIAADWTKIGRAGFAQIHGAAHPLQLITDSKCSREAAAELEEKGIAVTIV